MQVVVETVNEEGGLEERLVQGNELKTILLPGVLASGRVNVHDIGQFLARNGPLFLSIFWVPLLILPTLIFLNLL